MATVTFHDKIGEIEKYVNSSSLYSYHISANGNFLSKGHHYPISEYFEETFQYWGLYPINYVFIGKKGKLKSYAFADVLELLNDGKLDALLLLGYNDSGVYCFAPSEKSFQKKLEDSKKLGSLGNLDHWKDAIYIPSPDDGRGFFEKFFSIFKK